MLDFTGCSRFQHVLFVQFFQPRCHALEAKTVAKPRSMDPIHTPFMPSGSELWFALIEFRFENHRITRDVSILRRVAGHILSDVTHQVRDVVVS